MSRAEVALTEKYSIKKRVGRGGKQTFTLFSLDPVVCGGVFRVLDVSPGFVTEGM